MGPRHARLALQHGEGRVLECGEALRPGVGIHVGPDGQLDLLDHVGQARLALGPGTAGGSGGPGRGHRGHPSRASSIIPSASRRSTTDAATAASSAAR